MSDLVSTAPYIFSAFFNLVQQAGAQQSPPAYVAPFEIEQYEPASYVVLSGIRNHRFEWEAIQTLAQREYYDITGYASVWVGDEPSPQNIMVATDVMMQTYALFQACVMTPAMSNRLAPVFGAVSPYFAPGAVSWVLPGSAEYVGSPGFQGDAEVGWMGVLTFSFNFSAYIIPQ